MTNNHVFFDVDCIEITPNKVKFNCPERSQPISEELFEIYSLISAIVAPLVFTIHEDGFQPMEDDKRDFVFIPANKEKVEWKKSVGERYKFYWREELKTAFRMFWFLTATKIQQNVLKN